MTRTGYVLAAVLLACGLVTSGCGGSSDSKDAASSSTSASVDLKSLIPIPAGSQRTDGPDADDQNGIRMHFVVGSAPKEVMDAYKTALEGKGWTLSVADTTHGGGGGASYQGTNGGAYGLFGGGGYSGTTDVNSCVWPAEPTDIHCG